MTATILSNSFEFGPYPNLPHDIALEAGVSYEAGAQAEATAWAMASSFTRRAYRSVTSAVVVVREDSCSLFQWPIEPKPDALTIDYLTMPAFDWKPCGAKYLPEIGADLDGPGTYRLTQVGEVAAPTIPPHVINAVANLAIYLLVQAPQRREFKTQGAGDSNFTRESLMGYLWGSGAGPMLADQVLL